MDDIGIISLVCFILFMWFRGIISNISSKFSRLYGKLRDRKLLDEELFEEMDLREFLEKYRQSIPIYRNISLVIFLICLFFPVVVYRYQNNLIKFHWTDFLPFIIMVGMFVVGFLYSLFDRD